MKKIYCFLFIIIACFIVPTGCSNSTMEETASGNNPDKLTIVATLFPQYDFAREIAGDKAEILLLLPPGMESHSFEPTPGDIITIHNSDVFLYTGDEMEPWASGIAHNIEETVVVADLSKGIELCKDEHDHSHEEVKEDSDHAHEEEPDGHNHEYNPHIWTSPVLAMTMVENIIDALVKADPNNAAYYEANGAAYLEKLHELDHHFREIVEHADFDTIYMGSKFSLLYFMEEYGLHYIAAYDSCEEEAEPSIKRVVSMIKSMREAGITSVYYQELIEPYIAETIAEATGGETYLFHSCHNVSRDDLEAGVTYISLMEQNALNLEKGLNR